MNRFERRDNSTKVILIVVGAVVGTLLLVVLACGGVAFYFVTKAGQAMAPQLQAQAELMNADAAVQEFLNELSVGQVDAAYDDTTADFRTRQTPAQFKKFVERYPLLSKFTNAAPDPVQPVPGARRLKRHYTLTGEAGAAGPGLILTFEVVKDGEQWKVDSVSVP